MKNFKILMMIAGFSTAVVASEGSADKVATGYVQQGMDLLGSFGSYVSTKGSELSDVVSKQASQYAQKATELATSGYKVASEATVKAAGVAALYAKDGVDKVSTEAAKSYANSVKFVQDNPKAVGAATIVATVVAAVAVYRKYTLGYVFYKSKTADRN